MKRGSGAEAQAIDSALAMLTQALAFIDRSPELPPDIGARLQEVVEAVRQQKRPAPSFREPPDNKPARAVTGND